MIEVVLVCHEDLAENFLKVAEFLLKSRENCQAVGIREGDHPDDHMLLVEKAVKTASAGGNPVLILTDLFGGTACNVSLPFIQKDKVELLSGVNLAMLIRAFQWRRQKPNLSLVELASECAKYATAGIRVGSAMITLFNEPAGKDEERSKKGKKPSP
ncbi:MAG: PTS sugar transporter [Deltaproteobacteria bacterium]|nr:PTS sugar transporter [Deltaproteobacteria bacterium]